MIVTDTLSLAFRNLRQARLRTALTTLGVAIGIASLAGMVSLGVGLEEQTIGRVVSSGMFDQITVTDAAVIPREQRRAKPSTTRRLKRLRRCRM
jgi:ABC-type lipoprotein release transport system permease subunit